MRMISRESALAEPGYDRLLEQPLIQGRRRRRGRVTRAPLAEQQAAGCVQRDPQRIGPPRHCDSREAEEQQPGQVRMSEVKPPFGGVEEMQQHDARHRSQETRSAPGAPPDDENAQDERRARDPDQQRMERQHYQRNDSGEHHRECVPDAWSTTPDLAGEEFQVLHCHLVSTRTGTWFAYCRGSGFPAPTACQTVMNCARVSGSYW